jgi:hypothetical protein
MRGTAAGIADAVDENILYKSLFRLCLVQAPGVRMRRAVLAQRCDFIRAGSPATT